MQFQKRNRNPLSLKATTGEITKKEETPPKQDKKSAEPPKQVEKKIAKRSIMLMKVATRKSYTDVLEKLRKEVNPNAKQTRGVGTRPTEKGDLLISIGGYIVLTVGSTKSHLRKKKGLEVLVT